MVFRRLGPTGQDPGLDQDGLPDYTTLKPKTEMRQGLIAAVAAIAAIAAAAAAIAAAAAAAAAVVELLLRLML